MVDVHEGWRLGFRDSLSYAIQCVGDVVAVVSLLLFMLLLLWLCPLDGLRIEFKQPSTTSKTSISLTSSRIGFCEIWTKYERTQCFHR